MFSRIHARIDHVIDRVIRAIAGDDPLGLDMNNRYFW